MSVVDLIRELGWPLPSHPEALEEQEFDPHTGKGIVFLYETDACNFEVLDGGKWYKVDIMHPYPDLYVDTDVPVSVVNRVNALWDELDKPDPLFWIDNDPVPGMLEALRREFNDARFVNMTIIPGAIY